MLAKNVDISLDVVHSQSQGCPEGHVLPRLKKLLNKFILHNNKMLIEKIIIILTKYIGNIKYKNKTKIGGGGSAGGGALIAGVAGVVVPLPLLPWWGWWW